jgi:lactate dehydrogenase-like 2-hydroxyacid dehydrogenase
MAARPKILITRRLTEAVEVRARRDYNVVSNEDSHQLSGDEIIAMSAGADAIVGCITDRYTAAVMSAARQRRKSSPPFPSAPITSTSRRRARGIRVANAPTRNHRHGGNRHAADSRAARGEEANGCCGRRVARLASAVHAGHRLDGKRLGIFGMGQIRQALAKRARAFDMIVHYHTARG